MDIVDKRIRKLGTQFHHDALGGLRPIRSDIREERITPEGAAIGSRGCPCILRIAESNSVLLGNIEVQPAIFLAPVELIGFARTPVVCVASRPWDIRIGIELSEQEARRIGILDYPSYNSPSRQGGEVECVSTATDPLTEITVLFRRGRYA